MMAVKMVTKTAAEITLTITPDELNRLFSEHETIEKRAEELLDATEELKAAKANYTTAVTHLDALLIDGNPEQGAEIVAARIEVRHRINTLNAASEAAKNAKAELMAAWGVVNDLIDEKIDGLPLLEVK